MVANLNSKTDLQNPFLIFEPFRACLASKFAKSTNMTAKNFLGNKIKKVSKNTKFLADFKSVENVSQKFTKKGLRKMVKHGLNVKKVHIFIRFLSKTFFYMELFSNFSTDLKSA